jgi:Subtilase family/Viral BACON domain
MFIRSEDQNVYETLRGRNAVLDEVDYGSFKMIVADEISAGGRDALASSGIEFQDDIDQIPLNGYILNTADRTGELDRIPADLRQTKMADALASGGAAGSGLYVVQFIGPIKDEWLDNLRATGSEIVTYVPNNAYIVRSNDKAAARLAGLKNDHTVQYVGDYEPAFRMTPELQEIRSAMPGESVPVTVQVIGGRSADKTIAALKAVAVEFVQEHAVLNYRNVELSVPVSHLGDIASMEDVFNVELRTVKTKLDEAQGVILSGALSGNVPSGPGYLSFLATKGFNSSQFGSFAVNVADDAYQLTGASQHPDLPAARVAFQNNPTAQAGAQEGHGFLNSNIVGGFNSGTGSAVEDASGYNYGLGIAPFAKVGITAIFGNGASTPTAWESTAYGQTARISSNSWGFTGAAAKKYDANAQEYDRIVRDAQTGTAGNQQMIVVFAAGNDGSGANTVSSPATAKNVITAAASENVRQTGTDGCAVANSGADSANDIINFSSRGPVNSAGGDGRVKPDLSAPGTHIEAGIPQSNYTGASVCDKYWPAGQTLYGWSSGTSHSCPAIAGGMALVFQDFINKSIGTPSPAMAKAILMSSAAYMGGTGAGGNLPSNSQGMGRMDLGRAFDGTSRILVDQSQVLAATGNTYTTSGTISDTSKPVRITMAYSDAPGPTTGAPFVNNLDLEVSVGATTYKGNVFSGANSITGGTADSKNNVESVFLPAGTSGTFTVTVRATNIAGDGVPGNGDTTDQDFALVVYNATSGGSPNPTIGVSPSSLSYSATAGGANPAAQTVNISNIGGGTLNWTVTSNQPWLTPNNTSGTAPSALGVSVNIAGLAAGTYNGALSISGTGATNTPVSVPVTLTVNPAGGGCGGQLITNGGFEGSSTPWVLSGAAWSTGAFPHAGTGYSILGGVNNATGHTEYQTITIPAGCSANLNFWLNISSDETTTTTQFDKLFVEVRNTSGTLLTTLVQYSNLNKQTAGVYTLRGPFSLAAYAGQTVRVQFRGTTDVSLITSFRVDDVSVQ